MIEVERDHILEQQISVFVQETSKAILESASDQRLLNGETHRCCCGLFAHGSPDRGAVGVSSDERADHTV